MGSASRTAKAATVLGAFALLALIAIPAALAAFGAKTQNEGDVVTAAPDFTPPAITATVAAKSLGGVTGYVRKGGGYYVYANVAADTGNPASGIATVKTNAAELTSGQTEAALAAGTYTAGGVSYNYRSAELTATATVEGSKAYTVTADRQRRQHQNGRRHGDRRQRHPDRDQRRDHQRLRRHRRPRRTG